MHLILEGEGALQDWRDQADQILQFTDPNVEIRAVLLKDATTEHRHGVILAVKHRKILIVFEMTERIFRSTALAFKSRIEYEQEKGI